MDANFTENFSFGKITCGMPTGLINRVDFTFNCYLGERRDVVLEIAPIDGDTSVKIKQADFWYAERGVKVESGSCIIGDNTVTANITPLTKGQHMLNFTIQIENEIRREIITINVN